MKAPCKSKKNSESGSIAPKGWDAIIKNTRPEQINSINIDALKHIVTRFLLIIRGNSLRAYSRIVGFTEETFKNNPVAHDFLHNFNSFCIAFMPDCEGTVAHKLATLKAIAEDTTACYAATERMLQRLAHVDTSKWGFNNAVKLRKMRELTFFCGALLDEVTADTIWRTNHMYVEGGGCTAHKVLRRDKKVKMPPSGSLFIHRLFGLFDPYFTSFTIRTLAKKLLRVPEVSRSDMYIFFKLKYKGGFARCYSKQDYKALRKQTALRYPGLKLVTCISNVRCASTENIHNHVGSHTTDVCSLAMYINNNKRM